MLHEFVTANREEIISRCRAKVATRSVPPPTEAEIDHGVPLFLEQLVDALRTGGDKPNPAIAISALLHGHELLLQGFTVSQVVHDYGDICQAITELAVELNIPITADDFRMLNKCLDDAIAGAVTEYGREQNQSTRDGESARGTERLGFLAHELRNLINTAIFAFEVLKTGNVGVGGSTGAVLNRSLLGLRTLIGRSLAEVRFRQRRAAPHAISGCRIRRRDRSRFRRWRADARGIRLVVVPVDKGVDARRRPAGAWGGAGNLLQNAFKFTRPRTTVTLHVGASAERVLIEVHDECGGFPGGNVTDMFRPFEQRSADRTGLGLGLAFSRWGVEANNGRIYARNMPDRGCVFTLDLPRAAVPAVELA